MEAKIKLPLLPLFPVRYVWGAGSFSLTLIEKNPAGRCKQAAAAPAHLHSLPSTSALDSEQLRLTGSRMPLSISHRWTHPSACHAGITWR